MTSGAIRGSTLPSRVSSGHSADGSLLASALCTATWRIFGVKSVDVDARRPAAARASASPIRSSSQARSAAQSAGLTSARRRRLGKQRVAQPDMRPARGQRRIHPPHQRSPGTCRSPRPTAARQARSRRDRASRPARGSRRASSGYSTGGAGSRPASARRVPRAQSTISTAPRLATALRSAPGVARSCWRGVGRSRARAPARARRSRAAGSIPAGPAPAPAAPARPAQRAPPISDA